MKIFLDTAGIDEIRTAARWGVLDGVTTNPSLFAKVGGSYDEVLTQICPGDRTELGNPRTVNPPEPKRFPRCRALRVGSDAAGSPARGFWSRDS